MFNYLLPFFPTFDMRAVTFGSDWRPLAQGTLPERG
jgi:hypothetical protein